MNHYDQARERVHTALLCRTPIDPLAKIICPGLQKGNADLLPATRGEVAAAAKPIIGAAE